MGPDELFQRAVIARRYYLEGRTRVEIAEEFGVSPQDVRWALSFENARHASTAA